MKKFTPKSLREKYGPIIDTKTWSDKPIEVDSTDLCALLDMAEADDYDKVYIVTSGNELSQMQEPFYFVQRDARDALKKIRDEIRLRPGVNVIVDEPDRFEFLLGWEEKHVTWRIIERKAQ